MSDAQSFFLVIEGLDGSGKSEISRRLTKTLNPFYRDNVKLTFEPHDPSADGLFIRQVLTKRIKSSERSLAKAFASNRADHVERIIEPFLVGSGERVLICDRYYLSSLVYQSVPGIISMEEVWEFNKDVRKPDLTIFLYASPNVCYERIRGRGEERELFEHKLNEKIAKYSQAISFLREQGDCIEEVDANGDIAEVLDNVIQRILEHAPNWLHFQKSLFPEDVSVSYTSNEFEGQIASIVNDWKAKRFSNGSSEQNGILEQIEVQLDNISEDQLDILFLDYLRVQGYIIGDILPWTDVVAYELKYTMPIGIEQSGTALILPESQRYDVITRKMQDLEAIRKASHFIIVLDPNSSSTESSTQYALEITTLLSPATYIIGRRDIAEYIYKELAKLTSQDQLISQVNNSPLL